MGDKTRLSVDAIEQKLASLKRDCIELGLINDIVYNVEKVDRDTAKATIEEIVLEGVLTQIDVDVTYDVI